MGWVKDLSGQTVGLDSAPLIYFIEDYPIYSSKLTELFEAAEGGSLHLVTSTVTIGEVLVHPFRSNRQELVQAYRDILLGSAGVSVVSVSSEIAELAARLRADHQIRTPDAIQLATAIQAQAPAFVANDRQLSKISGLKVLVLEEL